MRILFVCTANVCRSPMAEAILSGMLTNAETLEGAAVVRSAGLLPSGNPMDPEAMAALPEYGKDMSEHLSHRVEVDDLRYADLVLGMTREHVRELVVLVPQAWGHTFTLKELVRRGEDRGARLPAQSLSDWLADVAKDRKRQDLLGSSPQDDVNDPIGGTTARFEQTARELADLCGRVVRLLGLSPGSPV